MSGRKKPSGFECFFCHKDMESPEGTKSIPAVMPNGKVLHLIRFCCTDCQEKLATTT